MHGGGGAFAVAGATAVAGAGDGGSAGASATACTGGSAGGSAVGVATAVAGVGMAVPVLLLGPVPQAIAPIGHRYMYCWQRPTTPKPQW